MIVKDSPFITILTASLNNGSTIRETLESVRNQSFQDLEHIVIDGGSCDETLDVLKSFENAYRLLWISEPDKGISDALNKGLSLAKGRYILVLHADDQLFSTDTIENVYSSTKGETYDIYSFPVYLDHREKGRILLKPVRIRWWHHFKTIFLHQGCFVHRSVFERIGMFRNDLSIAFDYDFFYKALSASCTAKFERRPVAIMGGKGISNDSNVLVERLREERIVQSSNEGRIIWKIPQLLFWTLYTPYKTRVLPIWGKR